MIAPKSLHSEKSLLLSGMRIRLCSTYARLHQLNTEVPFSYKFT